MDWWHTSDKIFRGRSLQENPSNSAERATFAKIQAPKFENSEPEKMQCHTPGCALSWVLNWESTES